MKTPQTEQRPTPETEACRNSNPSPKKTMNMTDEEMRIKIAGACGWSKIRPHASTGYLLGIKPRGGLASVPDYLKDLNAMHKAEKTMGDPQLWTEYEDKLIAVMGGIGWIWHATARQRAIAFIKTLNLEPK